jgi:hypothetical protein
MKITGSSDLTSCSLVEHYQRFQRTSYLLLQGRTLTRKWNTVIPTKREGGPSPGVWPKQSQSGSVRVLTSLSSTDPLRQLLTDWSVSSIASNRSPSHSALEIAAILRAEYSSRSPCSHWFSHGPSPGPTIPAVLPLFCRISILNSPEDRSSRFFENAVKFSSSLHYVWMIEILTVISYTKI